LSDGVAIGILPRAKQIIAYAQIGAEAADANAGTYTVVFTTAGK
jgi:hypothetical protein